MAPAFVLFAVLLLAGGPSALQAASISAALPIGIMLPLMMYGLVESLLQEPSATPGSRTSGPAHRA